MQKVCANSWCKQSFKITEEDLALCIKVSPTIAHTQYPFPPPTLCPDCRVQRRLAFRNERVLYHRNCDLTGKQVISVYSPDKPFTVFDQEAWWSDGWDPLSYGQDVDFSQSFFTQLSTLMHIVPRRNLVQFENENSDYTNGCGRNKDCYLLFSSDVNEKCYYVTSLHKCRLCVDCVMGSDSESCYECLNFQQCHMCRFCIDIKNCCDCAFCIDCLSCRNCAFCSNMRNKEFCIFNKQYDKEGYEQTMQSLLTHENDTLEDLKLRFIQTQAMSIRQANHASLNECCSGDYIHSSKNCKDCYSLTNAQDCSRLYDCYECRDCSDCNEMFQCELCYENMEACPDCYAVGFSSLTANTNNIFYCDHCYNSKYLFGCVGLKKNEHCILNKQYTKDAYEELIPKIIEHMKSTGDYGEFFSINMSPFGYNETTAQDHCPLPKGSVIERGWKWSDYEPPFPVATKTVKSDDLPASIENVPDEIVHWAIECKETKKPFKIIKQELDFYRQMKLPIPHFHPDERHRRRMALRNPRKLWNRTCARCQKSMQTSYAQDRPEIVYCEECYLKEVY